MPPSPYSSYHHFLSCSFPFGPTTQPFKFTRVSSGSYYFLTELQFSHGQWGERDVGNYLSLRFKEAKIMKARGLKNSQMVEYILKWITTKTRLVKKRDKKNWKLEQWQEWVYWEWRARRGRKTENSGKKWEVWEI